jgi:hypothetical protein
MIAVHCQNACQVLTVDTAPSTAHGEGHIVFTVTKTSPPSTSPASGVRPAPAATTLGLAPIAATLVIVAGLALVITLAVRRRRR